MGRAVFIPLNDKVWYDYYLDQAKQTGHGINGFQGQSYQRGNGLGSFFGRLFRSILPVAKRIGKSALKTVGKEALGLGANFIGDLATGRDAQESIKEHGLQSTKNLLKKAKKAIGNQSGGRIGKRKVVSTVSTVAKKPRRQQKPKKKDIFYNVKDN